MADLNSRTRRLLISGVNDFNAGNDLIDAILSGATVVQSVFGRTGAVVAQTSDYAAAQVTNAVDQTASYPNPVWLTSLAGTKISGDIPGNSASINGTITESQVVGLISDLANKAPLASPTFTGVPAGPTAAPATNTTQLATTAFVQSQNYQTGNQTITLAGDVAGAGTTSITTAIGAGKVTPAMLAGAIPASKLVQTDLVVAESQVTNLTSDLALNAPIASPTFTGTVTLPATIHTDATNITLGTTTGTKIGTATSQKLAFYNATPIVQPSGDLVAGLKNLGLMSTPALLSGQTTMSTSYTISANSTWELIPSFSLAIPTAGSYVIIATVRFYMNYASPTTNAFVIYKLWSSDIGADIANSTRLGFYDQAPTTVTRIVQITASNLFLVTFTSGCNVNMYVQKVPSGGSMVSHVDSDTSGYTSLVYLRIG